MVFGKPVAASENVDAAPGAGAKGGKDKGGKDSHDGGKDGKKKGLLAFFGFKKGGGGGGGGGKGDGKKGDKGPKNGKKKGSGGGTGGDGGDGGEEEDGEEGEGEDGEGAAAWSFLTRLLTDLLRPQGLFESAARELARGQVIRALLQALTYRYIWTHAHTDGRPILMR